MADFLENIVNQRFREAYEQLEQHNIIKGKSDLAKILGTYNHVINSILKGKRNITLDQLAKLFDTFGIDANYLFGTTDEMFIEDETNIPNHPIKLAEFSSTANITLLPNQALAGDGIPNLTDISPNHPKFSIPNMHGDLIALQISGDSMTPTLTNGDLVICEAIERGQTLRDNHIYILITDIVVAKRIQVIKTNGQAQRLKLISDNDAVYKPYELELQDIQQLLKVKCRLTSYAIE